MKNNKSFIIFLFAALFTTVGCKPQKPVYPESIVGPHPSNSEIFSVFNYDYEVRSAAFEIAVIYVDSGYVSKFHMETLWQYGESLRIEEWEPDSVTLQFVTQAYMITGQDIPSVYEGFISPEDFESYDSAVYMSGLKQALAEIEAKGHR